MKECLICGNCCEDEDAAFCPCCGASFAQESDSAAQSEGTQTGKSQTVAVVKEAAGNVAKKVSENTLVQAVKSDLHNSATVRTVSDSFRNAGKKLRENDESGKQGKLVKRVVAALAVVAIVVGLVLVAIPKECDFCGDTFHGKATHATFYGEKIILCKNCADYFD